MSLLILKIRLTPPHHPIIKHQINCRYIYFCSYLLILYISVSDRASINVNSSISRYFVCHVKIIFKTNDSIIIKTSFLTQKLTEGLFDRTCFHVVPRTIGQFVLIPQEVYAKHSKEFPLVFYKMSRWKSQPKLFNRDIQSKNKNTKSQIKQPSRNLFLKKPIPFYFRYVFTHCYGKFLLFDTITNQLA